MKLYEYAVLLHPTKKDKDAGTSTEILVPITMLVAPDDKQVGILAARSIPEEHLDKLDRIEVAVRPF